MSDLSAYIDDPKKLPQVFQNIAPADVPVALGVYSVAATLGTLQPGTYLISGNVFILNGAVGAAFVNSKVVIGAADYAPTEHSMIISGERAVAIPEFCITLPVAAAVSLQATADQIVTIKASTVNGGAIAGCTWITAVRIK